MFSCPITYYTPQVALCSYDLMQELQARKKLKLHIIFKADISLYEVVDCCSNIIGTLLREKYFGMFYS